MTTWFYIRHRRYNNSFHSGSCSSRADKSPAKQPKVGDYSCLFFLSVGSIFILFTFFSPPTVNRIIPQKPNLNAKAPARAELRGKVECDIQLKINTNQDRSRGGYLFNHRDRQTTCILSKLTGCFRHCCLTSTGSSRSLRHEGRGARQGAAANDLLLHL